MHSVILLLFICCILSLVYKLVSIKKTLYNVELKFKAIPPVDDGLRVALSAIQPQLYVSPKRVLEEAFTLLEIFQQIIIPKKKYYLQMYQGLYIWVYVNKVLKIIKKEKNTPNSLTKIQ